MKCELEFSHYYNVLGVMNDYIYNEPGREGGLIPTKTDDVYLLYLSHKPQTQSTNI